MTLFDEWMKVHFPTINPDPKGEITDSPLPHVHLAVEPGHRPPPREMYRAPEPGSEPKFGPVPDRSRLPKNPGETR